MQNDEMPAVEHSIHKIPVTTFDHVWTWNERKNCHFDILESFSEFNAVKCSKPYN